MTMPDNCCQGTAPLDKCQCADPADPSLKSRTAVEQAGDAATNQLAGFRELMGQPHDSGGGVDGFYGFALVLKALREANANGGDNLYGTAASAIEALCMERRMIEKHVHERGTSVPREPTPAMIDAVRKNDVDLVRDGFAGGMRKLWRAMYDAAPDVNSRSGGLTDAEKLANIWRAYGHEKALDAMVDRFLAWPLPETVCSDPCVTVPRYPHRIGTNLLTAIEARAMLEHVLGDDLPAAPTLPPLCPHGFRATCAECHTQGGGGCTPEERERCFHVRCDERCRADTTQESRGNSSK